MKAGLVSTARYHFFDLARQLDQRQMLGHYVTGYPAWKTKGDGLEGKLIHFAGWQTLYAASLRTGLADSWATREIEWVNNERIDRFAAKHLGDCSVIIAQACAGLHVGRAARGRGGLHFCDRGAAHLVYQNRLLQAEYERLDIPYKPIDPRKLEKEPQEYQEADGVLVPSEFVRQSFIAEGVPAEKVHKALLGVDLSRFNPSGEPPESPFRIMFVGALGIQKGVQTLLEAATKLRSSQVEVVLAGVESPEAKGIFDRYDPEGKASRIGHVPQDELIHKISTSHVLVLPSVQDGFGMVVAQAMACGVPCIVSDHAGAAEIVDEGENGFVFPARDAERLAELIDLLASNPDRRRAMGEAALRSVQQIGGWSQYGDRIVEILTKAQTQAA